MPVHWQTIKMSERTNMKTQSLFEKSEGNAAKITIGTLCCIRLCPMPFVKIAVWIKD
jgi:hypothetical protein